MSLVVGLSDLLIEEASLYEAFTSTMGAGSVFNEAF
jgi:hypothetical protein